MRLSQSASASSSLRGKRNRLGPSGRKKHKRLDSICENEYNRNHGDDNENSRGTNAADPAAPAEHDSELRRSTRVRRVPVILDLSPPPPKRRKKSGGSRGRTRRALDMGTEKGDSNKREVSATCSSGESDDDLCSWKSRLRSRVSSSSHQGEGEGVFPCRKGTAVKDYVDVEQVGADMAEDDLKEEEGVDGRNPGIIKSKRPGRSKASVDCEADLHGESEDDQPKLRLDKAVNDIDLNEKCCDEVEHDHNKVGVDTLVNTLDVVEEGMNHEAIMEVSDRRAVSLQAEQETEVGFDSQSEKRQICNDVEVAGEITKILKPTELVLDASKQNYIHLSENGPKQIDNSSTVNSLEQGDSMLLQDVSRQTDSVEVVNPVTTSLVDNNVNINGESDGPGVPQEKPLKCVADPEKVKSGKKRMNEGRRCGLCGGGTDGKPPKKLVQDTAGNYHEADIGSSGSEEPNYDVWDGFSEEPGWLGKLLGPINDRYGIAGIWVHQQCAVWSPEVYFAGIGCLKNIRAALLRGRALKCTRCGRPGATTGCRVDRCPRTYHLPCARASRCEFDHRKFLIACTDHRHLFRPHGYNYIQRRKKLKAKKLKLEIRKQSNDASRRDLEAEEKWLEKCGEDEEFLKRESKRLQRDMARMAPVYIGGSHSEGEKLFEGWESVGGLKDVIRCLKEVVILPLLYPEFFSNLGLTPPRGVLLHGHPGTGKTLVVRALIGSCARGDKRIAYFARKGADCLGKYVGDAERQLRLLFQVAEKSQPSIIFFDEIDGLAPVRSRQQDQTHSSVVSTLLALMDGLKNRGSVIVIGATNRPDAVDPALRRPGRFDREIYFPLPSMRDRAAILALHTRSWPKPLNGSVLHWIAKRTTNFAGADLQALCTHAAITALKRICPLHKILSDAARRNYDGKRPQLPPVVVNESDWLEALSSSPPPCSRREAGMAANEVSGYPLCSDLIPGLLKPLSTLLVSLHLDDHIWLPPAAYNAAKSIKNAIVSALEQKLWQTDKWWSHVHDLVLESDIACRIIRDLSSIGILVADTFSAGHNVSHDTFDENESSFGSWSSLSSEPAKFSMFGKRDAYRILIAGNPRSGQKHLASCVLLCFVGNIEIQKIDMATISQEGHGDMVQGITKILLRCASVKSCVVFLPRIDLWALEDCAPLMASQTSEEDNFDSADGQTSGISDGNYLDTCCLAEESELQGEEKCASEAWKSFIEQFGSIGVSTSLVVLATSEMRYPELPLEVRQFFEGGFLLSKGFVFPEHKVPRITVELDGKFNREQMAQSSASKLSWDMIKQFIHLIHHHVHPSQEPGMSFLSEFKGQKHIPNHDMDHGYKQEATSAAQCPQDGVRAAAPSDNKFVKEKSNMLMAIYSFGYQILTYPHFAELCWVTSKLKDGPCADVCGPWKGWPFNSCIVRPANAPDQEVVASTISNNKGKTEFTSVRGLVAVGLSAYRGVYTSLSQVSMDIREVLNLIVGEVNLRIQSGKERGQFFRLLSQVAYFEDMVNNWVYSLRSLESDAQTMVAGPCGNLYNPVSADKYEGCRDRGTPVEGEASLPNQNILNFPPAVESTSGNANIGAGRLHKDIENPEIEVLNIKEHSLKEVHLPGHDQSCNVQITTEPVNSEKEYPLMVSRHSHISSYDNVKDRSTNHPEKESSLNVALEVLDLPKEKSPQQDKIEGDPSLFNVSHSFNNISYELTSNEERGTASEVCMSENHEDPQIVGREIDTARRVNGSAPIESIISDDMNGLDFLGSYNNSIQPNLPLAENGACNDEAEPHCAADVELPCKRSTIPCEEYQLVCSYNCCSHCIDALHSLIQKVVDMEWERSGGSLTVEDAHDLVESLSTSLCLAVRKLDVENSFVSHETKGSSWRPNSVFNSPVIDACKCMMLETYSSPRECTCHSENLTKASTYASHSTGAGSSFIYKGCVLLPADSGKDVPLHCIHENLCLCPLIELIAITKCP